MPSLLPSTSDPPERLPTLEQLLAAYQELLNEERQALRSLDHSKLIELTRRKEIIAEALAELRDSSISTAATRDLVRALQAQAEENRLLISHAKACVSRCIDYVTGNPATYSRTTSESRPGMLHVKG